MGISAAPRVMHTGFGLSTGVITYGIRRANIPGRGAHLIPFPTKSNGPGHATGGLPLEVQIPRARAIPRDQEISLLTGFGESCDHPDDPGSTRLRPALRHASQAAAGCGIGSRAAGTDRGAPTAEGARPSWGGTAERQHRPILLDPMEQRRRTPLLRACRTKKTSSGPGSTLFNGVQRDRAKRIPVPTWRSGSFDPVCSPMRLPGLQARAPKRGHALVSRSPRGVTDGLQKAR